MRIPRVLVLAGLCACSLVVDLEPLEGHDAGADGSVTDASAIDADVPDGSVLVAQHQVCTSVADEPSSVCAYQVALSPGSSIVVHFYFSYSSPQAGVQSLTDDDGNTYTFLDVGNAACPAGKLANEICCTDVGSDGVCQGWAAVPAPTLAAHNPPTLTLTTSVATNQGMEVLEVSGLGAATVDQSGSAALLPDAAVFVPKIVTTAPNELVLAGIAIQLYGSTSLTPAQGWSLNEDPAGYAATLYQISGAAGATYGGTLGTLTRLPNTATGTILALKR